MTERDRIRVGYTASLPITLGERATPYHWKGDEAPRRRRKTAETLYQLDLTECVLDEDRIRIKGSILLVKPRHGPMPTTLSVSSCVEGWLRWTAEQVYGHAGKDIDLAGLRVSLRPMALRADDFGVDEFGRRGEPHLGPKP